MRQIAVSSLLLFIAACVASPSKTSLVPQSAPAVESPTAAPGNDEFAGAAASLERLSGELSQVRQEVSDFQARMESRFSEVIRQRQADNQPRPVLPPVLLPMPPAPPEVKPIVPQPVSDYRPIVQPAIASGRYVRGRFGRVYWVNDGGCSSGSCNQFARRR